MSRVIVFPLSSALLAATLLALVAQGASRDVTTLMPSEARKAIARELASTFVALDEQIPNLSPSQQQWLQTEYHDQISNADNRYTARSLSAANSLEYEISIVKPRTAELIALFTRIDSDTAETAKQEIALWSAAADALVDFGYWQAVKGLVDRGVVKPQVGHVDDLYFENYSLRANQILSQIVTPYLQGKEL